MASLEHLEEERIKLWARVDQLAKELADARNDVDNKISTKVTEISQSLSALQKSLSETDALARAKAQEDGQIALKAAKEAVEGRDQIVELKKEILTAKSEVDKAHAILAEYGNLDERAKLFVEKVQQLEAQIKDAKDKDAGAQASWTSINQQRQNVENLNSQVSKDAADIKSTVEDVKKIDAEVQEIKDSAEKELEEKAQKTKNSRLGRTDSSVRRCKRESKSRTITECTKTSKVTKSWRFR